AGARRAVDHCVAGLEVVRGGEAHHRTARVDALDAADEAVGVDGRAGEGRAEAQVVLVHHDHAVDVVVVEAADAAAPIRVVEHEVTGDEARGGEISAVFAGQGA